MGMQAAKAMKLLLLSAKSGNVESRSILGNIYETGGY